MMDRHFVVLFGLILHFLSADVTDHSRCQLIILRAEDLPLYRCVVVQFRLSRHATN